MNHIDTHKDAIVKTSAMTSIIILLSVLMFVPIAAIEDFMLQDFSLKDFYLEDINENFSSFFGTTKSPLYGTIQFPKGVKMVPDIRIYHQGNRVTTSLHTDMKRIQYTVSLDQNDTFLRLLITDQLSFVAEHNVIKHLTVPKQATYKLYNLQMHATEPMLCSFDGFANNKKNSGTKKWTIQEIPQGLKNRRVPDDAIIVCCSHTYVKSVEGGSSTSLPTIIMRPDLIAMLGSEKKLHNETNETVLTLLELDTLHTSVREERSRAKECPTTVRTRTT